ncbi:MAG: hypothetical protein RLZZ361_1442, partial [Cyanobacteriota bacterium]
MKKRIKIFFILFLIANQLVQGPTTVVKAAGAESLKPFDVSLNNTGSSKSLTKETYVEMEYVSGKNSNLNLYLDSRDLIINFKDGQPNTLRLRMDASGFFANKKSFPASFRVEAYEYDLEGKRKFLSTARPTVYNSKYARNLEFDIGVGLFITDYKTVYLEIYDDDNILYNTYKKEIQARNITSQSVTEEVALEPADCPSGKYDDCMLKYILENVQFEALPKRSIRTEVKKLYDGKYLVTIPIAKRRVNVKRGANVKDKDINLADNNGGDLESRFDIGVSETLKAVLRYDPVKKNFGISFGQNEVDKFSFTENGKLGVGIENPSAYLHVIGGDGTAPSLILEQGNLLSTVKDGAIEFDGNNFYMTAGGIRGKIVTTSDVGGKLTGAEVNDDFVLIDKQQIVRNKTFTDSTFSGFIRIPENAEAQKVLVSTGTNGNAVWSFIKKLGLTAQTTGEESLAIGNYVTANGDYSVVIGSGVDDTTRLVNNISKSLIVGFNGGVASLFVAPGNGVLPGNVGIGTLNPQALLEVNGTFIADSISSVNLSGNGAGLTNLNASNITHGILSPSYGGTGVSNPGGTMTFGANDISFAGGDISFTATAPSALTLPMTGTLATLAGAETFTNKTLESALVKSALLNGNTIFQDIASFNKSLRINDGSQVNGYVLVTNASGLGKWTDFSQAIRNANVSMDMLKDVVSDVKNGNIMVGNGSGQALSGGKFNTATGIDSLRFLTVGNGNIAYGFRSLFKLINGDNNVAIGQQALVNGTTGDGNIAIGFKAADNFTSGSNNITIGNNIDVVSATGSNQLNIGNTIFGNLNLQRVGIGAQSPDASLEIGDGTANFINGTDDLLVAGDIEADGDIYSSNFTASGTINGASIFVDNATVNNNAIIGNNLTVAAVINGSSLVVDNAVVNNNLTVANRAVVGQLIANTNINGADLTISNSVRFTSFSNGSLAFFGTNGLIKQDNSGLYYDDSTNRLGLGTTSPSAVLDIRTDNVSEVGLSIKASAGQTADIFRILNSGDSVLIKAGINGSTVFNEQGLADADFRIEGDKQGDLLFVDSSADNIGIATGSPTDFRLQVRGDIGPDQDATFNLGSNAKKWNKLFVNTINASTLSAGFSAGSIIFSNSAGSLTQDNANFFW